MMFERVVVERAGRPPLLSPFVACVECQAVYHAPPPRTIDTETRRIRDSARHASLMAEVIEGAKRYRKPSRLPRPGDRERKPKQ
jgi:hypothetical protein